MEAQAIECTGLMDMQRPIRTERVRGFQPPWRTVYVLRCPQCGSEMRLHKSGSSMPPGAVRCGRALEPTPPPRPQASQCSPDDAHNLVSGEGG